MSDYEADILTWSEQQAALLHRIARGELVNSAELDWPNIAEEIESADRAAARGGIAARASARPHAQGRGLAAVARRSGLAG